MLLRHAFTKNTQEDEEEDEEEDEKLETCRIKTLPNKVRQFFCVI